MCNIIVIGYFVRRQDLFQKGKKKPIVSDIVNKIDSGDIENGDLEMIMTAIGRQQSSKIEADSVHAGALQRWRNMKTVWSI